jgi:hypothetical protein
LIRTEGKGPEDERKMEEKERERKTRKETN